MTKYDIAIYGNLVYDEFINSKRRNDCYRNGGIGNIARHLKRINPKLKVAVVPFWTGLASFHFNGAITKLGFAYLNACREPYEKVSAKWSHLSYANCVGDMCKDFTFDSMDVSNSDYAMPPVTTNIAFRNTGFNPYHAKSFIYSMIAHDPGGSSLTTIDGKHADYRHREKPYRFTIGAGDMLVAEVMNAMLDNRDGDVSDVLPECHKNVIKELKREQTHFTVTNRW